MLWTWCNDEIEQLALSRGFLLLDIEVQIDSVSAVTGRLHTPVSPSEVCYLVAVATAKVAAAHAAAAAHIAAAAAAAQVCSVHLLHRHTWRLQTECDGQEDPVSEACRPAGISSWCTYTASTG